MVAKTPGKSLAWVLFDHLTNEAVASDVPTPWVVDANGHLAFQPDFALLAALLGVPRLLGSTSTSGVPALAVDVWVANEFRRAGFDSDAVWPRLDVPRVLPAAIARLLGALNKSDASHLRQLLATGNTFKGTVSANAKILGKNYIKQVDVGMSEWDTGPELLISTKRMDYSFGSNAPNRVEESYGDAKNLRSRHPRAALGFVFVLRSTAFDEAPSVAAWILDLLTKLGREDDAYDSVALVVPKYAEIGAVDTTEEFLAGDLAEVGLAEEPDDDPLTADPAELGSLIERLREQQPVTLEPERVPLELLPEGFFEVMIGRVLDNSPITRHVEARAKLMGARAG